MNTREQVAGILRQIKALPTLPDVAIRLLELGEKPTTSAGDLAALVERDMSLATRVLRLVNSSFFGIRREVTSIQHAIMILGTAQLRSVVLSGAVSEMFDRNGSVGSFNRAEFWRHSVATAAASRSIAEKVKVVNPEIAFTAGLIHDMGKVVEDRYLHQDFVTIIGMLDEPHMTMNIAETTVLGVSHAEIGHHLAIYWNLPELLREAVGYHHKPQDAPDNPAIAALVASADAMARELRIGSGGGADRPVSQATMRLCNLNPELYAEIREKLSDGLDDQIQLFVKDE
jgi:putative nucleotidyltransferase with HDIG domain